MQKLAIIGTAAALLLLASNGRAQDVKIERLRGVIERLQKENAGLKQEVERLQKEIASLKSNDKSAGEQSGKKVTVNGVEYEFVSLKRNGVKSVLRVAATSKEGNKQLSLTYGKVILLGEDGTRFASGMGPVDSTPLVQLPAGVRVIVAVNLIGGELPAKLKAVSTIQLDNLTGANAQPTVLKGKFTVEGP